MTQTTGTGTIFAVDLRVAYADASDLKFGSLLDQINDLKSLIILAHLLREGPLVKPLDGDIVQGTVQQMEMRTELDTRIKSLSYNSPLEIVLTLLGGTGMALAVANRVLSVHDRFQQSRLLRSDVNVRIAANDVILQEIQARGGSVNAADNSEVRPIINRASHALANITVVEMDPQRQQD